MDVTTCTFVHVRTKAAVILFSLPDREVLVGVLERPIPVEISISCAPVTLVWMNCQFSGVSYGYSATWIKLRP